MIARASRNTRSWHGPALPSSRIAVEAQIDERRDDDATSRGDQRQNGLVDSAQCAFMDLAPNLHAHDEEEDGHQCVVDPEMQRPGKHVFADTDCERKVPKGVIAMSERRVGPDKCSGSGREEHGTADSLNMQISMEGAEGLLRQPLGFRQIVK